VHCQLSIKKYIYSTCRNTTLATSEVYTEIVGKPSLIVLSVKNMAHNMEVTIAAAEHVRADSDNTIQCRFDVLCVPGAVYECRCIFTYFGPVKQNLRVPGVIVLLMLSQNNLPSSGDSPVLNGFDTVRQSSSRNRTTHNLQSPSFTAGQ